MNQDTNNNNKKAILTTVSNYEDNLEKLQNIVKNMEKPDANLSELLIHAQSAQQILQNCQEGLKKIEQEISDQK